MSNKREKTIPVRMFVSTRKRLKVEAAKKFECRDLPGGSKLEITIDQ
jgi:hypothetical protein